MSEQLQRGRWLIEDISSTQHLPEDSSPDLYLIYRTLGWFDTLLVKPTHEFRSGRGD